MTSPHSVSEEEVEAAARAQYEWTRAHGPKDGEFAWPEWDAQAEHRRAFWKQRVKSGLEAAARIRKGEGAR